MRRSWPQQLQALAQFKAEHRHARVPSNYVTPGGFRLGAWCVGKRYLRRTGRLSPEREGQLSELGFVWDVQEALNRQSWERGLASLTAFKADHGHLHVPGQYKTPQGTWIAGWCTEQRRKRREGKLTAEQIGELDELGFDWQPRRASWRVAIEALKVFERTHGHVAVPRDYVTGGGFKLGAWVQNRRARPDRLTAAEKAALDALGFVWRSKRGQDHQRSWTRGVAALEAFKKGHGHLTVPSGYATAHGFKLRLWCDRVRAAWRQGHLSAREIRELDELGFPWRPKERSWIRAIAELMIYKAEHGHLRVPFKHVTDEGFQLGAWVTTRRHWQRRGLLSDERIRELDDLGFVWEPGGRSEPECPSPPAAFDSALQELDAQLGSLEMERSAHRRRRRASTRPAP